MARDVRCRRLRTNARRASVELKSGPFPSAWCGIGARGVCALTSWVMEDREDDLSRNRWGLGEGESSRGPGGTSPRVILAWKGSPKNFVVSPVPCVGRIP
jgi:hypothetical protein